VSAFRRVPVLVATAMVLAPAALHACAVCFDAKAANRAAFLATTVFMSLLPLAMAAALLLWLRRRARARDGEPQGAAAPGASGGA
jgi:hypothetical protein